MTDEAVPVRWDQIVEGDQIYSPVTKRWHKIKGTVVTPRGTVKVLIENVPRYVMRPAADTTMVRRGPTGQAVEVFRIIFSGQTARDTESGD